MRCAAMMNRFWPRLALITVLGLAAGQVLVSQALAQTSMLNLAAVLGGTQKPIASGLNWRVYAEQAEPDGSHVLAAESTDATPSLTLADGQYIVHVALGLASATKRVVVNGGAVREQLVLNAGGLAVVGMLGDKPIEARKLKIFVYVPERGNSEAKLVLANAKAGEVVTLPEGTYHIVSTYLDLVGVGATDGTDASNATNSIVTVDLKVASGKVVTASLRHRAAVSTLKLVNQPGGEALANTSFTVLTPGGDVIRELIGAFPSLVLAEGDYAAIARHDGKTFQANFTVESTLDRDVEIIAK